MIRVFTISRKRLSLVTSIVLMTVFSAGIWAAHSEGNEVMVLSYSLAGRSVVIDPGHGGIDPGTIGRTTGMPEKDLTLAISRRLGTMLGQGGAMVTLTREDDRDLSDGTRGKLIERKRQDLARRVERAQKVKGEIYISVHGNADPSPQWRGAQTFYYANSPASKALAESIQQELITVLGKNNRKAKEGVFFVMERSTMPAVTVEVGFMSNPEEERLLADPAYQSKVAYAIYAGIVKYFSEKER
ncbi:MAG: N-acetylmuramoyl-L-alanine amidase [Solirubrobacterales bacterium]